MMRSTCDAVGLCPRASRLRAARVPHPKPSSNPASAPCPLLHGMRTPPESRRCVGSSLAQPSRPYTRQSQPFLTPPRSSPDAALVLEPVRKTRRRLVHPDASCAGCSSTSTSPVRTQAYCLQGTYSITGSSETSFVPSWKRLLYLQSCQVSSALRCRCTL